MIVVCCVRKQENPPITCFLTANFPGKFGTLFCRNVIFPGGLLGGGEKLLDLLGKHVQRVELWALEELLLQVQFIIL